MADKKHNCGVCHVGFATEKQYLDHGCLTGFTPKDAEHQGENFAEIQKAALARGEARKELE